MIIFHRHYDPVNFLRAGRDQVLYKDF